MRPNVVLNDPVEVDRLPPGGRPEQLDSMIREDGLTRLANHRKIERVT